MERAFAADSSLVHNPTAAAQTSAGAAAYAHGAGAHLASRPDAHAPHEASHVVQEGARPADPAAVNAALGHWAE